jgi:hypothetical protein
MVVRYHGSHRVAESQFTQWYRKYCFSSQPCLPGKQHIRVVFSPIHSGQAFCTDRDPIYLTSSFLGWWWVACLTTITSTLTDKFMAVGDLDY